MTLYTSGSRFWNVKPDFIDEIKANRMLKQEVPLKQQKYQRERITRVGSEIWVTSPKYDISRISLDGQVMSALPILGVTAVVEAWNCDIIISVFMAKFSENRTTGLYTYDNLAERMEPIETTGKYPDVYSFEESLYTLSCTQYGATIQRFTLESEDGVSNKMWRAKKDAVVSTVSHLCTSSTRLVVIRATSDQRLQFFMSGVKIVSKEQMEVIYISEKGLTVSFRAFNFILCAAGPEQWLFFMERTAVIWEINLVNLRDSCIFFLYNFLPWKKSSKWDYVNGEDMDQINVSCEGDVTIDGEGNLWILDFQPETKYARVKKISFTALE